MHCGPPNQNYAKSYAVNDTMMKRHSIFAHWRIYSFFLEPTDPLDLKSKTDGPFNCIRHGCFMCVNVTFRPRTSKIQSSCSSTTTTTPNVQGRQANGLKATTDHRRCGQAAASVTKPAEKRRPGIRPPRKHIPPKSGPYWILACRTPFALKIHHQMLC